MMQICIPINSFNGLLNCYNVEKVVLPQPLLTSCWRLSPALLVRLCMHFLKRTAWAGVLIPLYQLLLFLPFLQRILTEISALGAF